MSTKIDSAFRLQGVILDWAGTVVDHGCCAPADAFVDLFDRHGVRLSLAEAREPMGTAKRRHLELLLSMPTVAERWRARHDREPDAGDLQRLYEEYVPIQLECLARHATLIPGTLQAMAAFRLRGLRVGTTTGYTSEMMDVVARAARHQGFTPDVILCADQVPAGRPHPWMCFQVAMALGIYPMAAIVKIGDTVPDIEEGRNAGMWTIGVARTGNEVGLTVAALDALPVAERQARIGVARARLIAAGADAVVDGIEEVPGILGELEARWAQGDRPGSTDARRAA